jgi:AmmeMemoRadiSam system protein A
MNNIEQTIKKLVHNSIASKLSNTPLITKYDIVKEYPEFVLPKATFITLKINGRLRGCIGSLVAHTELYNDLVINAQKAAFKDPRFKPLSLEEFENTSIEISLLSDAILQKYSSIEELKTNIKVGIDGIILKYKDKQATYLPQVWQEINNFEDFFSSLAQKGGFDISCLNDGALVYKYQVQKIR